MNSVFGALGVFLWLRFGQRLDDVVESQPQTPTVVIESDGENQRHREQQHEHILVFRADNQQTEKADQEDHNLGSDNVGENRTNEEPILTFEERHAVRAMVPNMERVRDDLRLPAGRTS